MALFPRIIIYGLGGLLACIALSLLIFNRQQPVPEVPVAKQQAEPFVAFTPPDNSGFVGSEKCAECHADIAEHYFSHPMALSTRLVSDDPFTSSQTGQKIQISGGQRELIVEVTNDEIVHSEQMHDSNGELIYRLDFPMTYVMGSGQRARAYLERRGQQLFMSPINWYHQSDKWDLAPNYQPDDLRRFDRRAKEDCAACHTGLVNVVKNQLNCYQEPPFEEARIGCERCHGPGREHLTYHMDALAGEDPIVNPAQLDYERRESVCYQCHLSVDARVLRPGRRHGDFRPGMHLADIWAILDTGTDVDAEHRTKSVNHVQQMRASVCFEKSQGQLGCISCHDPHRRPEPEERAEFYRTRCLSCHSENGCELPRAERIVQQDDCTSCHLPRLDSSNMSHVVQTDHRILRKIETETDSTISTSQALKFFAGTDALLPEVERKRDFALGVFAAMSKDGQLLSSNAEQLLRDALKESPEDEELLIALGILAQLRGDQLRARAYFDRACDREHPSESSLDGRMTSSYELRDWPVAIECADRLLAIDPSDSKAHAIRGDALLNQGNIDEAISAVETASRLNPSQLTLREWLRNQYQKAGRNADAHEEAIMMDRLQNAQQTPAKTP